MDATRVLGASPKVRTMVVETMEDSAAFEGLRAEWEELMEASPSKSLFLTGEWLSTWWTHLSEGRRLCLITVRHHGRLVAIAPFMVSPPQVTRLVPFASLEFLGTGSVGSDYLDVIVRGGEEETAAEALAEHLARGRLMLQLAQVRTGSCVTTALARHLRQRGWTSSVATSDVCPFIRLSGHTWQSYLATLSQNHRREVPFKLRRLAKQFDVRFEQARSEQERREFLSLLVALHRGRWRNRGGGSTAFHTRGLLAFHEELTQRALDRGWLRLFILWLDGTPAAAFYGFRYDRAFSFYQVGFDPGYSKYSVGAATLALTIKQAIEEGAEEYDLLHGNEAYKFRWARATRELCRLELYPPHFRGWFYRHAIVASRAARRAARRVLPVTIVQRIAAGRRSENHAEYHATGAS